MSESQKFEHLKLNSFQQKYLSEIRKISPSDPFPPWKRKSFISTAGIIGSGWTKNEDVLVISHEGYLIFDPTTGYEKLRNFDSSPYEFMAKNNLEFNIKEYKEQVRIFGIYGGDGNHYTSDGWQLEVIYPAWSNSIVVLRTPTIPGIAAKRWENLKLLKLNYLEYHDLKCGFSNTEDFFLIVGSGGIEIFTRNAF